MEEEKQIVPPTGFKVVGLIAAVVAILACFIGAVTWINTNMANNAISIQSLQSGHARHEVLISKNSEVLNQHAQLLAIIREQGKAIDVLTDFMTQGGRFTESDGIALSQEVQKVKDRLHHYAILETELGWIKKSIVTLQIDIKENFEQLDRHIYRIGRRQDKVYDEHGGTFEHSWQPEDN